MYVYRGMARISVRGYIKRILKSLALFSISQIQSSLTSSFIFTISNRKSCKWLRRRGNRTTLTSTEDIKEPGCHGPWKQIWILIHYQTVSHPQWNYPVHLHRQVCLPNIWLFVDKRNLLPLITSISIGLICG